MKVHVLYMTSQWKYKIAISSTEHVHNLKISSTPGSAYTIDYKIPSLHTWLCTKLS